MRLHCYLVPKQVVSRSHQFGFPKLSHRYNESQPPVMLHYRGVTLILFPKEFQQLIFSNLYLKGLRAVSLNIDQLFCLGHVKPISPRGICPSPSGLLSLAQLVACMQRSLPATLASAGQKSTICTLQNRRNAKGLMPSLRLCMLSRNSEALPEGTPSCVSLLKPIPIYLIA